MFSESFILNKTSDNIVLSTLLAARSPYSVLYFLLGILKFHLPVQFKQFFLLFIYYLITFYYNIILIFL